MSKRVPPDVSAHLDQIEAARANLMLTIRSRGATGTIEAHAQQIDWATQKLMDAMIDEAQLKPGASR